MKSRVHCSAHGGDTTAVNPDELFNMLAQQSNVIEVPVYEQEDGSIRLGVGVQIKSADDEDDNVYASTPDTPTAPFNRQLRCVGCPCVCVLLNNNLKI